MTRDVIDDDDFCPEQPTLDDDDDPWDPTPLYEQDGLAVCEAAYEADLAAFGSLEYGSTDEFDEDSEDERPGVGDCGEADDY